MSINGEAMREKMHPAQGARDSAVRVAFRALGVVPQRGQAARLHRR